MGYRGIQRLISDQTVEQARVLLASGFSLGYIADELEVSRNGIKRRLDPEYRLRSNECVRNILRRKSPYKVPYDGKPGARIGRVGDSHGAGYSTSRRPPPEVMAERDAAARAGYQSLTAAMAGDPLPGRSALDRLKGNRHGQ